MKRLKLSNGTSWPDPTDQDSRDAMWTCIHSTPTKQQCMDVVSLAEAYCELVTHPAFTLKVVQKKVSMIRKAIKEKTK